MSQFGGSNEVKTVFTVDATQVGPAVDAAQAKVDQFKARASTGVGDAGAQSVGQLAEGAKKAIKPLSDTIGLMTRLAGIVGIVTGALAGVVAGLQALATWMERSGTRVQRAQAELNSYRTALDQLGQSQVKSDTDRQKDEANKQYDALRERLGKLQKGIKDDNEVVRLFAELESQRAAALAKIDGDAEFKAREKSRLESEARMGRESVDRVKAREQLIRDVIEARSSDEEKIEAEKQERIKAIREAFNQESQRDQRDALIRQAEVTAGVEIGKVRAAVSNEQDARHEKLMQQIQERRDAELRAVQEVLDAVRDLNNARSADLGAAQAASLGVSRGADLITMIGRRVGR